MAGNNHFLTQVYGVQYPENNIVATLNGAMGRSNSFPSAGARFYPTDYGTIAGVTMASVVELLPTGLNKQGLKFYTPDTVATLNTNAT